MYLPTHFEEARTDVLRALIAEYPLGMLVTLGAEGLDANHIPFLFEPRAHEQGALIGHVARNNPVWHDRDESVEALVVFRGPAAYISPTWYPTKQETHEVVPTYNYAVVHVHGNLIVHEDAKWLRGVVGRLTKTFEANQATPWKMADAPAMYLESQLKNIVGIEIPINRITGKWKVSQNRVAADRAGAAAGLRASGTPDDVEIAALISSGMTNRKEP